MIPKKEVTKLRLTCGSTIQVIMIVKICCYDAIYTTFVKGLMVFWEDDRKESICRYNSMSSQGVDVTVKNLEADLKIIIIDYHDS